MAIPPSDAPYPVTSRPLQGYRPVTAFRDGLGAAGQKDAPLGGGMTGVPNRVRPRLTSLDVDVLGPAALPAVGMQQPGVGLAADRSQIAGGIHPGERSAQGQHVRVTRPGE